METETDEGDEEQKKEKYYPEGSLGSDSVRFHQIAQENSC